MINQRLFEMKSTLAVMGNLLTISLTANKGGGGHLGLMRRDLWERSYLDVMYDGLL